jgi:ribose 5-phosphate isomerase A
LKPEQGPVNEAKRRAALEAVKHVKDSFIIGLGSGSTAAYAIEAIAKKADRENLNVKGIPTSMQAFSLAVKYGIPVTTLEEHNTIDLSIDGADQIDPNLNLIKGMGAALTREKIVASASKQNIIIADESKQVKVLGEMGHPVPVEVLPFSEAFVKRRIEAMGGKPVVREGKGKLGAVITDNGNMIMDAVFGEINDPTVLAINLKMIPGVIETGLFVGLTDVVYLGSLSKVKKLQVKSRISRR